MILMTRILAAAMLLFAIAGALLLMSGTAGSVSAQQHCARTLTSSQFTPVVVSFETGSVKLGESDRVRIADAARLAKANYIQLMCVTGYADKQGDAKLNALLSLRRADTVGAELRKNGIATDMIVVRDAGEPASSAFSGLEFSSAADRRVEIRFAR